MSKEADEAGTLWVQTKAKPGGGYGVQILVDDDLACNLTPTGAQQYAAQVIRSAVQAQYDAGLYAALMAVPNMDHEAALTMVDQLRRTRRPVMDRETAPLRFLPGVSMFTREPFVHVFRGNVALAQLDVADTYNHALQVLSTGEACIVDSTLRGMLTGRFTFDDTTAMGLIRAISDHVTHVAVRLAGGGQPA